MPLYPLQKIRLLAEDRQTYLRGVGGYNAGWVTGYTVTVSPAYSQQIAATVHEAGISQRVSCGFDHQGRVADMSCTCGRRRPGAACKHLVAALVHKYYSDMLDTPAAPTAHTAPAAGRATDPLATQLIDRYLTAETRRLAAAAADSHCPLIPVLYLEGVAPVVSFRVGSEHSYQIKNLHRFAKSFFRGEEVTYGKSLTLLHHPGSFEPTDRPLLGFLLSRVAESKSDGGTGELILSPSEFDRFFALIMGREVLLRTAEGERTVYAVEDTPTLAVTVEKAGDGLRLIPERVGTVFGGEGTVYLLRGDTLARTSPDYTRRLGDWLQATRHAPDGLYVAPAELGGFCGGVLPHLRPYIRLEGEGAALEGFTPPPLRPQIHLDKNGADITAQVLFCYGDVAIDPYAATPAPAIPRDIPGELPVKLSVGRYFAPATDGRLVFSGEEERLFDLLQNGIPALQRLAQVTLGEALAALLPDRAPTLHFGVSLMDGLLEMAVEAEGIDRGELAGILTGYRENRPYYRLKSGRFLPLGDGSLADLYDLTRGLGLSPKDLTQKALTLPAYRAMYIQSVLDKQATEQVSRDSRFTDLVARCQAASTTPHPVPPSLEAVLRDYQKEGFRWLATMEQLGFGGILADDMGLGKTLQMITLMLDAKERGVSAPHLVVCPTSVVLGWEREIARFAPVLSTLCVIGDAATRQEKLRNVHSYNVIITSYDMLKRDVAAYADIHFHYQVLDEAQYIKNSATQNARAVKAIHAAQRFALTGTPVENRLSELWSIFDFLMPGMLYSQQKFRARFETPILRDGDDRVLERLGRLVSPFILRRLKSQVLTQLPPKTERVLPATMERAQRQVYLDTLAQLRSQLTGVGDKRLYGKNRMTVLAQLTRLRQLCCDPRLCCEGYTGGSAKLEACMELLREAVRGGHKVLLFSQFTSMLSLIKERLEAESLPHYLLQGSTPKEQRAAMVDAFNRDSTPIFLISLKAGGVGLNLTGADMVIHYDPWWNVAAQNQATDRAHRIGQQKPVQVVRLIAKDTIEERILRMQEQKWQLAKSVVETEGPSLTAMTAHELLSLLDGD